MNSWKWPAEQQGCKSACTINYSLDLTVMLGVLYLHFRYLIENRKTVGVGQLGSKLGLRSRAAVAIATALLNDADIITIHHIDR